MSNMKEGAISKLYSSLKTYRSPYLERARSVSELTIPHLVPEEGSSGTTSFPTPYQSVGAAGVNNLAAKLLLALLPPGSPFFRLELDKFVQAELGDDERLKEEFAKALSDIETATTLRMESSSLRTALFTALLHLLVAGNVLLYKVRGQALSFKAIPLTNYVCKRDPSGRLLKLITMEEVAKEAVSEDILQACECSEHPQDKPLTIYTLVEFVNEGGGKYQSRQELNGKPIPKSESTYPVEQSPYLALRFHAANGEDYGRGYVESYYGDLHSLEHLTKSIVKGNQALAKLVFLVAPNSVTDSEDIAEAETGDFVTGREDDVTVIQSQKQADFASAERTAERLETRLATAFLLHQAVQRDAERVTAEEIRYMANELDDALGGVYSVLSQELQLPLVNLLMADMEDSGDLPRLPKDQVQPVIVTGLEALGRTSDLQKLDALVQHIFELSPEIANAYVNLPVYLQRRGSYLQVDTDGLIRKQEEVDQIQQQQQMQALMQNLSPEMLKQVGETVRADASNQ